MIAAKLFDAKGLIIAIIHRRDQPTINSTILAWHRDAAMENIVHSTSEHDGSGSSLERNKYQSRPSDS